MYGQLVTKRDLLLRLEDDYHTITKQAVSECKEIAKSLNDCIKDASGLERVIQKLEKDPINDSYYDWGGSESCRIYKKEEIPNYKLELTGKILEKEEIQNKLNAKKEFIVRTKSGESKTRRKINRIIKKIEDLGRMCGVDLS